MVYLSIAMTTYSQLGLPSTAMTTHLQLWLPFHSYATLTQPWPPFQSNDHPSTERITRYTVAPRTDHKSQAWKVSFYTIHVNKILIMDKQSPLLRFKHGWSSVVGCRPNYQKFVCSNFAWTSWLYVWAEGFYLTAQTPVFIFGRQNSR